MGTLGIDEGYPSMYNHLIETTNEPKKVLYLGQLMEEYHMDWYYSYKEERNY